MNYKSYIHVHASKEILFLEKRRIINNSKKRTGKSNRRKGNNFREEK